MNRRILEMKLFFFSENFQKLFCLFSPFLNIFSFVVVEGIKVEEFCIKHNCEVNSWPQFAKEWRKWIIRDVSFLYDWTALDTEYFLLKCSGPLEIQVIYRDASTEDANKTHKFKKKCKVLLWSSYKSVFVCQPYFRMLPFRWFLFLLISIKPFWHKADF